MEKKLTSHINKTKSELNHDAFKTMIFLKVCNFNSLKNKEVLVNPNNAFKNTLLKNLNVRKRDIIIKFEIFNEIMFEKYFIKKERCKLLVIEFIGD